MDPLRDERVKRLCKPELESNGVHKTNRVVCYRTYR